MGHLQAVVFIIFFLLIEGCDSSVFMRSEIILLDSVALNEKDSAYVIAINQGATLDYLGPYVVISSETPKVFNEKECVLESLILTDISSKGSDTLVIQYYVSDYVQAPSIKKLRDWRSKYTILFDSTGHPLSEYLRVRDREISKKYLNGDGY